MLNMPKYALLFLFFTMASIGLPGTSGFVGEFLALAGIYKLSTWAAFVCTTGIILGAAYMLYLYRRVAFGDLVHHDVKAMKDMDGREMWLLAPIAAVVLWMGVYPESFMAPMRNDVSSIVARLDASAPKGDMNYRKNDPATKAYRKAVAHGTDHGPAKDHKAEGAH